VLTGGGDAPGMNAAIRAVAKAGIESGFEVIGETNGFSGLIEGKFQPMTRRSASGIIQAGGSAIWDTSSGEPAPNLYDRLLGTRLGAAAAAVVTEGQSGALRTGTSDGEVNQSGEASRCSD
jgi:6-phosphofructokinase